MEKTDRAWLYCGNFGWSHQRVGFPLQEHRRQDQGWQCSVHEKDLGEGNENSMLVCGDKKKLYAIKGLKDYVVVDTGDVLLIARRTTNSSRTSSPASECPSTKVSVKAAREGGGSVSGVAANPLTVNQIRQQPSAKSDTRLLFYSADLQHVVRHGSHGIPPSPSPSPHTRST